MKNLIESLNWRYATKSFDSAKKLSDAQLQELLTAVQLSPSSYGLQPYKVLVVSDQDIKEKLKAAAYGQAQLVESSQVFIFAIEKNFSEKHVDVYAKNISETWGVPVDAIQGFVDVMKGAVNSKTAVELDVWNAKQAYIALGILLEAAALHGIDACPMEGFNNAAFDEILGLEEKGLQSVVIAPVGFRSETDAHQHHAKVRKSKEGLFIHI